MDDEQIWLILVNGLAASGMPVSSIPVTADVLLEAWRERYCVADPSQEQENY